MSVFTSLLNHTFTDYRRQRLQDGQGGWAIVWAENGIVTGRLRPLNASERSVAQQEQSQIDHKLYVVAGSDIARGDVIVGEDKTVKVLAILEPSHADHHYEIDCQEVGKEQTEWGS